MKKIAIFSPFLFLFSFALLAQETENFSLAIDKNRKATIIQGDASKQYDNIILYFIILDTSVKDVSINFYDAPNYATSLFTNDKILGNGIGQWTINKDTIIVKIQKMNGKYYVDGYSTNEIPPSFSIKISNEYIGPFNLKHKEEITNSASIQYQIGYIYYDAFKLIDQGTDIKTKAKILNYYNVKSDNPYLSYLIQQCVSQNQNLSNSVPLLSHLGNTDVTYFAAGLARFLAERTKEELNEAFFNKMNEQLNAYPELKIVFPKTASFLDIIETYSYAAVIQVLKEAFETDIQNLPENLYNVKSLTSANCDTNILKNSKLTVCQDRINRLKAFFEGQDGRWIGLGLFTVKEAIQSSNPADLLKSIIKSDEFKGIKDFSKENSKCASFNVASSIELCNFISQSLMSKDNNQVWINSKELNALITNEDAFKVYLGLLLAREQSGDVIIDFYKKNSDPITFGEILKIAHNLDNQYEPDIKTIIKNAFTSFNSANNAIKKIIAATDKSVEADPQAMYDYYRTFTASLKPIAHSKLLDSITGKNIGKEYDKIEQYLNPAVDIAYHISTKKYSAAIYDAVVLLNSVDNPVFEKQVTKSFIKYGTLISTVANAQSSDEVKKALEASVLPVGSSAIKRNSALSFSINAYVGSYYNYSNSKDYLPTWGLSAPVGFNISGGISKIKKLGTLSLNLQIIDLGALVNYYLIKGDTASIANDFSVKLSNIFAPGFNLCYNIPKTPISIAWGGQHIPALYKYEQINGKNELTPTNAWRWQASVLIDIPLFNLIVRDFKK